MIKYRITAIAILFCALFCAASTFTASATDHYWNVASGDWSVGTNWTPEGPPGYGDIAYIENQGVAYIHSSYLAGIYLNAGYIEHNAGTVILNEGGYNVVGIGVNNYYLFSGVDSTYGEYNLHDGGLEAEGSLTIGIQYGRFNQYGGTVEGARISVSSQEAISEYNLYGGTLTASMLNIYAGDGRYVSGFFNQHGGSCDIGVLDLEEAAEYNLHDGSLVLNDVEQMFGKFNIGSGGFSLELLAGTLDLSRSVIGDVSAGSFQGGAQSLLILPKGFDPYTHFGSFATDGLVHVAGSTLTIAAGYSISTNLRIDDHVVLEGECTSEYMKFGNGVSVLNGGVLSSESTCITGGVSNLDNALIHRGLSICSTTQAQFNQSSGTLFGNLSISNQSGVAGVADVYNISGGLISASYIYVGNAGFGRINQTGGKVTFDYLYVGFRIGKGEYFISDGELLGDRITLFSEESSLLLQTGGTVSAEELIIRHQAIYSYAGGVLEISDTLSIDSDGILDLQADWASSVSTISLNGTLSVADGKELTINSQKSIDIRSLGTIKGTVNFVDADGSIYLNSYGTLDLSQANLINASMATLTSGTNSLIVVAAGYDITSVFGTTDINGTIMETCDTFVVAAGEDLTFNFTLPMAVEVYGTLRSDSSALGAARGLIVKDGGVLDVGNRSLFIGTRSSYNNIGYSESVVFEDGSTILAGSVLINGSTKPGGTVVHQYGGTVNVSSMVLDGCGKSSASYYQHGGVVNIGDTLYCGAEHLGASETYDMNYRMIGGTMHIGGDIKLGGSGVGRFYFNAGEIYASSMIVEGVRDMPMFATRNARGEFNQTGGTFTLSGSLQLMSVWSCRYIDYGQTQGYMPLNNTAEYRLTGGELIVGGDLDISQYQEYFFPDSQAASIFRILGGHVMIGGNITVWENGVFNDEGSVGGTIDLFGNLVNNSMLGVDFDLRHTTLIMHGGSGWDDEYEAWDICVLNMNSINFGATVAGLDDNFAIGDLVFSGNPADTLFYRLESDVYCYGLSVEKGANIDLNGYNIYYMPAGYACNGIAPATHQLSGWFHDGEILAITDASPIPEPGTIILIGSGVLALAGVVRKRVA